MQYLQKGMGDEVGFLPADKRKSFLQVDSITSSVHSQVCPKYLQENMIGEVDIFPADRFLQSDTK